MISTILMWMGGIVCIIGAVTIILLGLMFIRDWALQTIYDWKFTQYQEAYKHQRELLAVVHLKKLKDDYPELEISYKGEELQDWED